METCVDYMYDKECTCKDNVKDIHQLCDSCKQQYYKYLEEHDKLMEQFLDEQVL
jgi:hypothetical protein